jgi:hypothetical protein
VAFRGTHHGEVGTVRDGVTDDERRSIVVVANSATADDDQFVRAQAAVRRLVDTVLCQGVR